MFISTTHEAARVTEESFLYQFESEEICVFDNFYYLCILQQEMSDNAKITVVGHLL